jgi:hypothetical protein
MSLTTAQLNSLSEFYGEPFGGNTLGARRASFLWFVSDRHQ